jgi:hypothetical protein
VLECTLIAEKTVARGQLALFRSRAIEDANLPGGYRPIALCEWWEDFDSFCS